MDNLLEAWKEFIRGKRKRKDVQVFALNLMDNILSLHNDLVGFKYRHGGYQSFNVNDPKPRNIHKTVVRDRLLHHAIYRILYPFFDGTFIADSFSCRNLKGTHKAINRFRNFAYEVSKNDTKTCWILKCDIKKFFENIDHEILLKILNRHMSNEKIMWLLKSVIDSFHKNPGKGLPLGNLTSQLFANVYMNEFDRFVKHRLKAKYYVRYADDFVIFSPDKSWAEELILKVDSFLSEELKLKLHPDKIFISTLYSGVDFLGWVHFPDHRVLRTATKRRMFKKLAVSQSLETHNSYLGLLRHGNAAGLLEVLNKFEICKN